MKNTRLTVATSRMRTLIRLVFILILSGERALGQDQPQTITVPLSKPKDAMTLNLEIFSARIEVIGEDRHDAEFTVVASGSERKIVTPSGARSLPGGSYELNVKESHNTITVGADPHAGRLSVVAKIPHRANLVLSTSQNGEIVVRDIVGNLQLENSNGPVSATNIQGSVIAESMNEAITVSLAELSAGGATSLSSLNGDISLALPAKAAVELRLDTARGQIDSDFELDVKTGKPEIERTDGRDGVSVRVKDVVVATLNGGGPVIRIKTLSGNIRIVKSSH